MYFGDVKEADGVVHFRVLLCCCLRWFRQICIERKVSCERKWYVFWFAGSGSLRKSVTYRRLIKITAQTINEMRHMMPEAKGIMKLSWDIIDIRDWSTSSIGMISEIMMKIKRYLGNWHHWVGDTTVDWMSLKLNGFSIGTYLHLEILWLRRNSAIFCRLRYKL